ncbi:hypothetical protein [Bradyrhizobium sp. LHD-71]|uniref:hypothetical protein n=1 Tax=Bradyrhizobium sp. LHD-71 TaxID=3072141 RepID=UPI0028104E94|nr:hypothetical protein [Bradyrhizobium sp. LHD-71]MDQ8730514.1 hypothetical protein [Bradyrhizobium sp. LHD-71]
MREVDPNTRERPLAHQMVEDYVPRDCSTSMIGTLSVLALAIVLGSLFWNIASTNRAGDPAGTVPRTTEHRASPGAAEH